ncbi:phage tail sheath subtilisin-like domain-containing protein [Enterobacter roggenkampii]|uniref:phage tail sheath subtilisin-like domain-containing protein n=1 Tax=Enterobacter roggenkampii TaxID=1812935 RepID=UPI001F2CCE41|nr:phage tail sheath subtilisin-like domain-containing protein [Enterobacter roggenkampii]
MTVSFNTIPSSGILVPLFYAEMDNSQANTATATQPTVIFGHALSGSTMPVNQLTLVSSVSELKTIAGAGSQLARMAAAYRNVDNGGQLWVIAVPEPAGAKATGTILVGGAAIAAGVISLYIGVKPVQIAVNASDTAEAIGGNIVKAINASHDLPVIAEASEQDLKTITLTAKNIGLCGNEIPVTLNYYGSAGGETLPQGVTITITAMTGGAGAPNFTDAVSSLGDEDCDFIAFPYNDSASLDAIGLAMNDSTGRWAPGRQSYGHVYSAKMGDLASLQSFGTTRNDQHVSIDGNEPANQTCSDEWAAIFTARNAVFIRADPARPTQTGQLNGALPAPAGKRFQKTQRNTLLNSGIATSYAQGSNAFIERAVTTYQKNSYGEKDNSYLDSETLHTSAYVLRTLETCVTSKYGRHKLANDGTRFGSGQAIVTPAVIKAEMCAQYQSMEEAGIVENFELFKKYLVVERDKNDPNRVNVLFPPDYINQLRVFALVNQFRLQYKETA